MEGRDLVGVFVVSFWPVLCSECEASAAKNYGGRCCRSESLWADVLLVYSRLPFNSCFLATQTVECLRGNIG
ncbi:hypothetical protein B0T19DRAFT_427374 [Cercophora scortea]|uniref:Secreted protein n=1 Tax=Cercophora scortea TaxID=314031 RepID=A0AAE0M921_9PEZI|nr:hypothetical protein B0T19DRAFT_427374 [Cercophora scortea]